jgi:hypothetical protein
MKRILSFWAAAISTSAMVYGCSSDSNGNGGNATPNDGGGGTDAPVMHHDGGPLPLDSSSPGDDSSPSDDSSVPGMCPVPGDLSMWTPPAQKMPKTNPTACSAKDLADYDAACWNNTTRAQAACTAFGNAHPACVACLESMSTDSTWGPIVQFSGVANVNVAGCLALTDPGSTCGKNVQDYELCVHTACDAVCPVTDTASFNAWKMCESTVTTQACATYNTKANCIGTEDAGAACSAGTDFDTTLLAIAPLFCGGFPVDGGAAEAGPGEAGPPGDAAPMESGLGDAPGE